MVIKCSLNENKVNSNVTETPLSGNVENQCRKLFLFLLSLHFIQIQGANVAYRVLDQINSRCGSRRATRSIYRIPYDQPVSLSSNRYTNRSIGRSVYSPSPSEHHFKRSITHRSISDCVCIHAHTLFVYHILTGVDSRLLISIFAANAKVSPICTRTKAEKKYYRGNSRDFTLDARRCVRINPALWEYVPQKPWSWIMINELLLCENVNLQRYREDRKIWKRTLYQRVFMLEISGVQYLCVYIYYASQLRIIIFIVLII